VFLLFSFSFLNFRQNGNLKHVLACISRRLCVFVYFCMFVSGVSLLVFLFLVYFSRIIRVLIHFCCFSSPPFLHHASFRSALAEKCHAYAKALHYKELEFHTQPAATIEALISINNQLQQPEV
jgi:hypothetical protein